MAAADDDNVLGRDAAGVGEPPIGHDIQRYPAG
jgi:hypothetical protein